MPTHTASPTPAVAAAQPRDWAGVISVVIAVLAGSASTVLLAV